MWETLKEKTPNDPPQSLGVTLSPILCLSIHVLHHTVGRTVFHILLL